ncbi:hypothetical protein ACH4GK_37790 [Streptomyces rimosus]
MLSRSREDAVCVFTSPAAGREDHDENGVHPLLTETEAARP